jgi:MFS family permease
MQPRHFWRQVGFNELSELYTSQLLRSLAVHLIGLFTPVYLYSLGYSLVEIALFHVGWFIVRPAIDIGSAFIIARIGPKHTMLMSAVIHVTYLALLLTLETYRWPLIGVALVGTTAYGLYLLALHVDFSKIKHTDHGGKELSYLVTVERLGAVAGPVVGGVVASFYDPRYTIGLAMCILLISAVPLFLSAEAVQTRQKIKFKGLDWRPHARDYVSAVPATLENAVSIIVWPLFISVFILGENAFAKLGAIVSLSTLSSILLSRSIGGLIDNQRGRQLLVTGSILNALLHLYRPFALGISQVTLVNIINEPITAMYRMPYMKGLYDSADSLPGYRIAYLASIAALDAFARLIFWLVIWLLMMIYEPKTVLIATFIFASICSLAITSEKFKALRYSKA